MGCLILRRCLSLFSLFYCSAVSTSSFSISVLHLFFNLSHHSLHSASSFWTLILSQLLSFSFCLSHSHFFFVFFMMFLCITHPLHPLPFLHLSLLASATLSGINCLSDGHFFHSHMPFIIFVILLRPHTAVETLSRHDMSWVSWLYNTTRGKGPVVVVFYSLWTVWYRHMAPS